MVRGSDDGHSMDAEGARTETSACFVRRFGTYDEEDFRKLGGCAAHRDARREAPFLVLNFPPGGILAGVLAESRRDHRADEDCLQNGFSGEGGHLAVAARRKVGVGGWGRSTWSASRDHAAF